MARRTLTVADIAKYTSAREVLTASGWLIERSPGDFRWQSQCISGNCASASQLAVHFGIHREWLNYQGYVRVEDKPKFFKLVMESE